MNYTYISKKVLIGILSIVTTTSVLTHSTQQATVLANQVKAALAHQGVSGNQPVIVLCVTEAPSSSWGWKSLAFKLGLAAAACYTFDYYFLGGRITRHMSAKTKEIISRIDLFEDNVNKHFEELNKKIDLLTNKLNKIGQSVGVQDEPEDTTNKKVTAASKQKNSFQSTTTNNTWYSLRSLWNFFN